MKNPTQKSESVADTKKLYLFTVMGSNPGDANTMMAKDFQNAFVIHQSLSLGEPQHLILAGIKANDNFKNMKIVGDEAEYGDYVI